MAFRISLALFWVLVAGNCAAADSAWDGTWRLNVARSRRTGATMTVATAADGRMVVSETGLSFSFRCDDQGYPLPGGRSLFCHRVSATVLRLTAKQNGDELAQTLRTISDHGRTMTAVVTGKAADGTAFRKVNILRKLSGDDGWNGVWHNTAVDTSAPDTVVVKLDGRTIVFTYPAARTVLAARLDGTPSAEQGPHTTQGEALRLTADGPRRIREVDSVNGTVVEHNTLSVSGDGATLTIEELHTGEKTPQVYVYDRSSK